MISRPLRIAQVAPPLERVPPLRYGGTERVVYELTLELQRRGHEVTVFASGDSEVPVRHIPTVPQALRPQGFGGDALPYYVQTEMEVLDHASEFDLIHSHLEWNSLTLAAASTVPVVSTFHGRLDWPFAPSLLAGRHGLVAISRSQAAVHPDVPWEGVVYNGLTLKDAPFDRRRGDDLCFVGRIEREKGVLDAIEIAKRSGRHLKIAAKIGTSPEQRAYHEDVFLPALEEAGSLVEFLGEVDPETRDDILASSYACLIPATWPEPFGLVTIESLACGTPVIARRAGALPEVVRDGIDGFLGDDAAHMAYLLDRVPTLDRAAIRNSAIERFSPERMTDEYEAIYERRLLATRPLRPVARLAPAYAARAIESGEETEESTPAREVRGADPNPRGGGSQPTSRARGSTPAGAKPARLPASRPGPLVSNPDSSDGDSLVAGAAHRPFGGSAGRPAGNGTVRVVDRGLNA